MRLNDAKADPQGRLWFGSMNNLAEHDARGLFYRLDTDGSLHTVDDGYAVTNGPTFSLDGRTLFHTDSHLRTIYAGAPHTTNCCFGGDRFSDLYITSARIGLDEAKLAAAPLSGALFFAHGVGQGRAAEVWRG